ncbi:ABC transporter permease [Actinocorallia sp. A-T 12471]|uniref:ABC transporter permease n=1 Tax=Actinocorallia sp. A-T 12471 TaxID=3089813 RepID=UPI0029CC6841|nr:ABC transporter permease [Actinocorallia sp. A-T 12471]MDX6743581.1 ABC transporter permease [Actinocorallia sp. A-T 12471]
MRWGRRVVRFVLSLGGVVVASFAMLHLIPGDPVRAALGPTAPADVVARRRSELGLDRPLPDQFTAYVGGIFRGDLGESFLSRRPAAEVIGDRLPATVQLVAVTMLLALAVAVPLGMWAAARTENGRGRCTELAFTTATGALSVVPEFLLAVGMVAVFGVTLGWLPVAGKDGPASFVMPVLALAAGPTALLARLVRVETLRELGADYVRLARAKRLPPVRVHLRHLLPNTLTATLTTGGLLLASLLGGSVVIEYVFQWPGLGGAAVEAIAGKDYALAQAAVLVYGAISLTVLLAVDLALGLLDRRSALGSRG